MDSTYFAVQQFKIFMRFYLYRWEQPINTDSV